MKADDYDEFVERETTAAALSKKAKQAKRRKRLSGFSLWLAAKAERIEQNGNPAGAAQFRKFWKKVGRVDLP